MNAPSFPTNPAVGEFFGNWVWNGVRWVCNPASGVQVLMAVYTASGPYMPSPGLVTVVVEALGGGGGGGGALATNTATTAGWMVGGGGGSSGGYSRSALAAALVLGGVNMTIGAPGAGGTFSPPVDGAAGGATTFGALVTANGGNGGQTCNPGAGSGGAQGGAGADYGIGTAASNSNPGQTGGGVFFDPSYSAAGIHGGDGGAGFFGGAGQGGYAFTEGASPGGTGWDSGGGGGAASGLATAGANGGNGGTGFIVITEYCWADSAPDDCLNPPVNVNARVAVTQVPWTGPGPCPPGWGQGPYVEYEGK